MRKTKIICTLGPASDNKEIITELINSGMNISRHNFSHGTYEDNGEKINMVKEIRQEINNSDINTVYEYSFNKLVSNNNSLSKFILKVYNLTNSYISLFYILLAVFIIILFVINLKQKSRIFGIAFGTLGVVSLVFMIIEKQVLEKKLMLLLNEGNELININIFYILTVVFIVLSVLLLLIHNRVKE